MSRTAGQRRNLGYPALIVGVLLVGSVLVFFAREQSATSASAAPVANRDHWHAAFGIDICGQFQGNLSDQGPDTLGIHTHQDGLIHIHPYGSAGSGERAVFGLYAAQIGIELGDGEFTLPDGQTFTDGDDCETDDGTEPGRVALYVWPRQATDISDPEIYTEDIANVRFTADGQAFVLAFVPEDAEVGLPPTVPALANPIDLEPPPVEGSTEYVDDSPTPTVPEGAASDSDGADPDATEPDTTEPGEG